MKNPVFLSALALVIGIGIFGNISNVSNVCGVYAAGLPCCCQQLTVQKIGAGTGTVTSDPVAISCGPTCQHASHSFSFNTNVTLTAAATIGRFMGWSGGGCDGNTTTTCTVLMDMAHTITAHFEALEIRSISAPTASPAAPWVRQGAPFDISVITSYPATCTLDPANHNLTEVVGSTTTFRNITQHRPVVYTISCTDGQTTTPPMTRRINVLPRFGAF